MTDSPSELKSLHLASDIEELEKRAYRDVSGFREDMLMNSAEKLFHNGLKCVTDGDEETAYVYFLRFKKICALISKKHPEIVLMRLKAEIVTSDNLLITLKKSLMERYVQLTIAIINLKEKGPTIPVGYENMKTIDLPAATDISDGIPLKGDNRMIEKNLIMTFPDGFISTFALYWMICGKVDCVIFDTRPKEDYKCSNMKFEQCVNIPDHLIKSGLSANLLGAKLPKESVAVWERRNESAIMILADWSTTKSTASTSKLMILKNIICSWDLNYDKKIEVVFLDGGYLQWWENYPMYCTNAHDLHNERNIILSELIDIDKIDYPMSSYSTYGNDLPMPYPPSYDRSLKPIGTVRPSRRLHDHEELHARWEEYYTQLEAMKVKRRQELEDLRSEHTMSEREKKMRLEQGFIELESKRLDLKELGRDYDEAIADAKAALEANENVHALRPSVGKTEFDKIPPLPIDSPTIATTARFESLRQKLLIEAREKKKPILDESKKELEEPETKKPIVNVDYIKTCDLRERLTAPDRMIDIPRPLHVFNLPPPDKVRRARRGYVPGVTGLKNLGNTCFMNSIIQVFSNTRQIAQYFINNEHLVDLRDKEENEGPFARYLGETIIALWTVDGKDPYYPTKLKKHTYAEIPHFVQGHHQDAHEFFIKLIEFLHEELKHDMVLPRYNILTPMQESWVNQSGGKISRINDWFLGQMRATMKCNFCYAQRDKFDTFYNLNLDLPIKTDECSLDMCLDMYFQPQHLHGYKCPKCKNQESVTQTFKFAAYPPYIVITLNRFKLFNEQKGDYMKNHMKVNYYTTLNLQSFKYNLYGVVYHYGEMGGGHYVAICQNPVNQQWYRFDDDYVDKVKPDAAINPEDIYLLFYQMDS